MATEIRVPTLGESVVEATVGQWFKQAGDAVAVDEPLVELETDKVTVEVPAPASGVLSEIVVNAGDTVEVGALLGAWIASQVHSRVLAAVFATLALLVAAKMVLLPESRNLTDGVPRAPWVIAIPTAIGCFSSMMGIGGGTLSVPAMTWLGIPVHRAVGTSAWFGLWIAMPAAAGYAWLGRGLTGLPPLSVGYVNLVALLVLLPSTVVAAPLGAKLAHGLSRRQLSLAFGCFLLLTAARMAYRSLAA